MNKKQQALNLLGLAQRAGKLISGEEQVIKSIQNGSAHLVLVASDASHNLIKTLTDKCNYYDIEVSTAFDTLELSSAIGRPRKAIALADAGFTKKMRTLMNE